MPSPPRSTGTWVTGPPRGGGLLGGGHGHVGGAEVDLPGAERGDARAAAHRGVADGHGGVLLVVVGEGRGEERRVERRPGPGQGGRAAGAEGWPPAQPRWWLVVLAVQAARASRMIAAAAAADGRRARWRCPGAWALRGALTWLLLQERGGLVRLGVADPGLGAHLDRFPGAAQRRGVGQVQVADGRPRSWRGRWRWRRCRCVWRSRRAGGRTAARRAAARWHGRR